MTDRQKGLLAALGFAVTLGFSFLFMKIALRYATPIDLLAHRFTAAMLAGLVFVIVGKRWDIFTKNHFRALFPVSLIYPTLFFFFQALGLDRVTSSEAGIINASMPIFTLVLASFILGETSCRRQKGFILLSAFGIGFIFAMQLDDSLSPSLVGSLFMVLSIVSNALYKVLARRLTKRYDLLTLTFITTLYTFIYFNGIAAVSHIRSNDWSGYVEPLTSPAFLGSIAFLGMLASFGAGFLSNYALSKIKAATMSVFSNVSTLLTITLGITLLGETLAWYHVVGGMFVVCGVIGTTLSKH